MRAGELGLEAFACDLLGALSPAATAAAVIVFCWAGENTDDVSRTRFAGAALEDLPAVAAAALPELPASLVLMVGCGRFAGSIFSWRRYRQFVLRTRVNDR
jgi:hypothetical protein